MKGKSEGSESHFHVSILGVLTSCHCEIADAQGLLHQGLLFVDTNGLFEAFKTFYNRPMERKEMLYLTTH